MPDTVTPTARHRQRAARGWRGWWRRWPTAVWVAAGVAALYLAQHAAHLTSVMGLVDATPEMVAPLETGRLVNLQVTLGQHVKAGDVVATMDPLPVDMRSTTAELRALELQVAQIEQEQRLRSSVYRADEAANAARVALLEEQAHQERARAELAALSGELTRLEELVAKGLVTAVDLARLRPQVAALQQDLASEPALLAAYQQRVGLAATDAAMAHGLAGRSVTGAGADSLAALQAMEAATLATLQEGRRQHQQLREACSLRATRDAVVSEVLHYPGDVVTAGQTIVRLVTDRPTRVVGYLPANHAHEIALGTRARLYSNANDGSAIDAVVESVAPEIESLPMPLSPLRAVPLRARRVVLRLQGETPLVAGEAVRVEIGRPGLLGTVQQWWHHWTTGVLVGQP